MFKQWFTTLCPELSLQGFLPWQFNLFVFCHSLAGSFWNHTWFQPFFHLPINTFLNVSPFTLLCCVRRSPYIGSLSLPPPFAVENDGILTAFQLPQGLRGLDDCRMLMFEASALNISGGDSGETKELRRARRLYQSDSHGWKIIPWRILIRMSQICLRHSCTSPNPRLSTQVPYRCAAKLKTPGWHVLISKRGGKDMWSSLFTHR